MYYMSNLKHIIASGELNKTCCNDVLFWVEGIVITSQESIEDIRPVKSNLKYITM